MSGRTVGVIPTHTVTFHTDTRIPDALPGDLVICATSGRVGAAIRFVTRSWANHACVVIEVTPLGGVIVSQETPRRGDVFTSLTKLGATRIALVRISASGQQRNAAIAFAQWVQWKKYGFASLVGDLFNAAFRTQLAVGIGDTMVCSTATCRAAERTGYIPSKAPESMTPGDLTIDFGCPDWPAEVPPRKVGT